MLTGPGELLLSKFTDALDKITEHSVALERATTQLGLTDAHYERFLAEEKAYLENRVAARDATEHRPVIAEYVKALQRWWAAW